MIRRIILMICFCVFLNHFQFAQSQTKKAIDIAAMESWNNIKNARISNDGNWLSYKVVPYKGDGKLHINHPAKNIHYEFPRGANAIISSNSDFIVFKILAQQDSVRKKKLNKVEKDAMPKDSLAVYMLNDKRLVKFSDVKSFKLPEENSTWVAFLHEKKKEKPDSIQNDSTKKKNQKKKNLDKNIQDISDFEIFNPLKSKKYLFKNICEYAVSRKGSLISFIKQYSDTVLHSRLFVFNTQTEKLDSFALYKGISKKITVDNAGTQIAFVNTNDTCETKVYSLFYWNNTLKEPQKIIDTLSKDIPAKWTVSEYGEIYFSRDDSKLFFGIAPKPISAPKDTLLEEEKVKVDLWSWKDPLIQPQQLVELDGEKKRSYLTVYHTKTNKIIQLGEEKINEITTVARGNGNFALGITKRPYEILRTWENPEYKDVYLIDVNTGIRKLILQKFQSYITISSSGNYLLWYDYVDSSWYSYSVENQQRISLTKKLKINFYNEDNDMPANAEPYGTGGCGENDVFVLLYDHFDIWKIDPSGKTDPVNLTNGFGRKNQIEFRYLRLDDDEWFINPNKDLYLRGFNIQNKQSGYFSISLKSQLTEPKKLVLSDNHYYTLSKSKNAEKFMYQKGSFIEFPDIWYCDKTFGAAQKISNANPQQNKYLWGSVELFKWLDFDGMEDQGLLYKPENFDATKKYPMIVYFYDRSSDELFDYQLPKLSRSTINITHYISNGYLVFVPDIKYVIGYPGESAYKHIVSGTMALTNQSFVDKERIGLQGQSWGGYQVGYLVTRTNLFHAAMAGAPVSNMVSAYGGIRWESGMSRMFQYEETQSRIGGTLWQKPFRYIENSPIFFADKVNTPLLIMSNDNDGAVPWYQGIEYYMALRRLNKPVWLLNYNGEPHNLRDKSPNSKDLTIRMMQFFDYYLKGSPAPEWLIKGIPAIEKGKKFGYNIIKE